MPTAPQTTLIRHNVFVKSDRPSGDGDRPNVLVGGVPNSGTGSQDTYQIYGNVFAHNPRESLLQAEGTVFIHDNIFVDAPGAAVYLRSQNIRLRRAHLYQNTFYSVGTGISVASAPSDGNALLVGNIIFAVNAISGVSFTDLDNIRAASSAASDYLIAPSITFGAMDFFQNSSELGRGAPLDLGTFSNLQDFDKDFNGNAKGSFVYRGAYAGQSSNPGWKISLERKPLPQ
jgi:hypothetical protein